MTNGPQPRRNRLPVFAALGAAVVVAGMTGVYVMGGADGNREAAASCPAALDLASAVAPLASGEVAAFLPASKPLSVADLSFTDDSGTTRTLGDFAGRTVLLNLWATWCAPCRKEMPALGTLQAEMGSDEFEVVAVNVDLGSADKPKAFLADVGVTDLTFYADSSMKIFKDMRSRGRAPGLPATMLIGHDGCEIGTLMGPAEWASDDAKALIRKALEAPGT